VKRITHHDLRHLFATRCIEAGVDIPTVSRWLGHQDGGALCMKTYGHPLSINSHVANVLYFGRVKVNGKPIRQASGPAVAGVAPPAGVANELAPDTNARTIPVHRFA